MSGAPHPPAVSARHSGLDAPHPHAAPPPGAVARSSDWMPALDGLRALSILLVLTAHVYTPGWKDLGGHYGVTVFFVLSGFLITRLLIREERDTGALDLRGFYIRRVFRLFPIYYVVLAIYCLLLLGLRVQPDAVAPFRANLPWYATYLQEIPFFAARTAAVRQPFYQSWSLGIEEKFYLVWPFLAFVLVRAHRARVAVAIACIGLLSAAPMLFAAGRYVFPYASIASGCLLALLADSPRFAPRVAWLRSAAGAALALLAWIGLHAFAVTHRGTAAWAAEVVYPIAVSALLVASLAPNWLGRLLSTRLLVFLGNLSYGIYLVHILARSFIELLLRKVHAPAMPGPVIYVLMLAGAVLAAWLLQITVETPARRFGRRLAAGARRPAAVRAPVAS